MEKHITLPLEGSFLNDLIPAREEVVISALCYVTPVIEESPGVADKSQKTYPMVITDAGVYFMSPLSIPIFVDWSNVNIVSDVAIEALLRKGWIIGESMTLELSRGFGWGELSPVFRQICSELKANREAWWVSNERDMAKRIALVYKYSQTINRPGWIMVSNSLMRPEIVERLREVLPQNENGNEPIEENAPFIIASRSGTWLSPIVFSKSGLAYFDEEGAIFVPWKDVRLRRKETKKDDVMDPFMYVHGPNKCVCNPFFTRTHVHVDERVQIANSLLIQLRLLRKEAV